MPRRERRAGGIETKSEPEKLRHNQSNSVILHNIHYATYTWVVSKGFNDPLGTMHTCPHPLQQLIHHPLRPFCRLNFPLPITAFILITLR
jgi:hypothetical protein